MGAHALQLKNNCKSSRRIRAYSLICHFSPPKKKIISLSCMGFPLYPCLKYRYARTPIVSLSATNRQCFTLAPFKMTGIAAGTKLSILSPTASLSHDQLRVLVPSLRFVVSVAVPYICYIMESSYGCHRKKFPYASTKKNAFFISLNFFYSRRNVNCVHIAHIKTFRSCRDSFPFN